LGTNREHHDALLAAVAGNLHVRTAEVLLSYGAGINSTGELRTSIIGEVFSHTNQSIISSEQIEMVKLLLDRGYGINADAFDRHGPSYCCNIIIKY
jgi:hypothetical protein